MPTSARVVDVCRLFQAGVVSKPTALGMVRVEEDTAALALAWLGFQLGRRDADARRSFGYARFEVLAGLVNAVTMIGIVALIVYEAVERIGSPQTVLAGPMLAVAVVGLGVNLVAFRLLHGSSDNVNVRGALVHVIGDLLGSAAAIVAALVILAGGPSTIDPLLSLLVAALVLRSALLLLRQTAHILLEGTPEGIDAETLGRELALRVDGVRDVHHVHVWSLSSGRDVATMHVRIREGLQLAPVLGAVKALLRDRFGLAHTTVQICPEHCPDDGLVQDHPPDQVACGTPEPIRDPARGGKPADASDVDRGPDDVGREEGHGAHRH
jgi:cobalt-zinc-cadmium efflux system protein